MKIQLLLALMLLLVVTCIAQSECGTDIAHHYLMQSDSLYRELYNSNQKEVYKLLKAGNSVHTAGNTVYTIPVVVHVIHLGEPVGTGNNISDAQIVGAINGLNDRFANVIGAGLDIEIQFCLAVRNPDGCPTNGIVRVNGSGIPGYAANGIKQGFDTTCNSADQAAIKDLSKWPVADYYNIWVVNKIECGTVAGYAYYPNGFPYDGTAIVRSEMVYNSMVLAHEVGHGWNLPHTFGGGQVCPVDTNCSVNGDMICDTPPHRQTDCGNVNPCSATGNWNNSRYNYMSYCSARNRFTADQKDRMRATMLLAPRASLLNSSGCTPGNFGSTVTVTNVSCNLACDAAITVTPSCPFTYSSFVWSNGMSGSSISGLCAGIYTVTITTSTNQSVSINITVDQPDEISTPATALNPSCYGFADGSIILNPAGGTPYNCGNVFPVTVGVGNNFSYSDTTYPNPYGNYAWGAKHQFVYTAQELRAMGFTSGKIHSLAFDILAISGTNALDNFEIKVGATADSSIYIFKQGLQTVFGPQTVNLITGWNVHAFTTPYYWDGVSHLVVQTCYNNNSSTFNSPVRMFYVPNGTRPSYFTQNSSTVCSNLYPNGFVPVRPCVQFAVCNDTAYYNYMWGNGSTQSSIAGLADGNYAVSITDVNGCADTLSINLTQPDQLNIELIGQSNPGCFGGNDGAIQIANTGGVPPYINTWSNGQQGDFAVNLSQGFYTVTVTDGNSCTDTFGTGIANPPQLSVLATCINLRCFSDSSGQIAAMATGGTAGYMYYWNTADTAQVIQNLAAGSYSVTVSDANGCSAVVSSSLTQPSQIFTVANIQHACNICDGAVSLNSSGGIPPYKYIWAGGDTVAYQQNLCAGTYFISSVDSNNCVVNDSVVVIQKHPPMVTAAASADSICYGQQIQLFATGAISFSWYPAVNSSDSTGQYSTAMPDSTVTYIVTGTDSTGCHSTSSVFIMVSHALPPVINAQGTLAFCSGDSVVLFTAPYSSYVWNTGSTLQAIAVDSTGLYSVTVVDSNNCIAQSVPVQVTNHGLPVVSLQPFTPVNDNSSPFVLTGGTPPGGQYSINGVAGNTFSPSVLGAGNHLITYAYTDTNGCSNSAGSTIQVLQHTGLSANENYGYLLFPNPNKGSFIVMLQLDVAGFIEVECSNSLGQVVFYQKNWAVSGLNKKQIMLAKPGPGVYTIAIRNSNSLLYKANFVVQE